MPTTSRTAKKTPTVATEKASLTSPVERLAARRAAHDALFAARKWRHGRQPVVAIAPGGDAALIAELREALKHIPAHVVELSDEVSYAAVDIVVFATDDLAAGAVAAEAVHAGAIPVIAESVAPKAVCSDYEPTGETGNAFFARSAYSWALFAALVRAVETFRFPYDWQGILRNAMK